MYASLEILSKHVQGNIRWICHCAPRRCHAVTIARTVNRLVQRVGVPKDIGELWPVPTRKDGESNGSGDKAQVSVILEDTRQD